MIPNRLQKTDEQYAIKAKHLCYQAARAHGYESPHTVPLTTVAEYVIRKKATYSRNTWRQYKSALLCHAEQIIDLQNEKVVAEEAFAAIRMLKRETSEGCMKHGTRTSALKQKTFKKADFNIVLSYLDQHVGKHKYARTLSTWLKASRITGMRPSEWEFASLTTIFSSPALVIQNAKATNGRANGDERTLLLDMLTEEEIDIIQEMIGMVEGYSESISFSALQKTMCEYMNRATRACFGKRQKYPTLYSNRHQFSADAKFSGHSKAEVAALLGQASDETATSHYAHKRSGESSIKVSPLTSEVKTVRIRSRAFTPRKQIKAGK